LTDCLVFGRVELPRLHRLHENLYERIGAIEALLGVTPDSSQLRH
jgi:hypothetical protein